VIHVIILEGPQIKKKHEAQSLKNKTLNDQIERENKHAKNYD